MHIPFQPPDDFAEKYGFIEEVVLRGLLRFTKIGFQVNRDRKKFIELVQKHWPLVKVEHIPRSDGYTITHEGTNNATVIQKKNNIGTTGIQ